MNDYMAINCPSSPEAFCPEWLANPLIAIAEPDRPSISKVYVEMDDGSSKFPITQRTIVCGDGETCTMAVECIGVISKLKYKTNAKTAVFEVIYKGEKCIAKCWIPESVFEWVTETNTYQLIESAKARGEKVPDCFSSLIFSGTIMCSSIFPEGFIIIMEKRAGNPVSYFIDDLCRAEQESLVDRTREGIALLDSCGNRVRNQGILDDLLYCRESGQITIIDFSSLIMDRDDRHLVDESGDEGDSDAGYDGDASDYNRDDIEDDDDGDKYSSYYGTEAHRHNLEYYYGTEVHRNDVDRRDTDDLFVLFDSDDSDNAFSEFIATIGK